MKKYLLIAALFFAAVITTKNVQAQVRIGVNINIGSQPVWGPVGYDYVDYYYLPDIDVYYYVPRRQFIYFSGGSWIFATSLPLRYRGFDLYSGYKVVINEPRPYLRAPIYRTRYAPFRGRHDQIIIRNSDEPKYYVVKGHPKFNNGHDNGNHYGEYKNGNGNNGNNGNGNGNGKGNGKGKGRKG